MVEVKDTRSDLTQWILRLSLGTLFVCTQSYLVALGLRIFAGSGPSDHPALAIAILFCVAIFVAGWFRGRETSYAVAIIAAATTATLMAAGNLEDLLATSVHLGLVTVFRHWLWMSWRT